MMGCVSSTDNEINEGFVVDKEYHRQTITTHYDVVFKMPRVIIFPECSYVWLATRNGVTRHSVCKEVFDSVALGMYLRLK